MECPLVLLAFLRLPLFFLVGIENHVSGPHRCKSCALIAGSPRNALCYQIPALQIGDRAVYGSVIELPVFVSIEEAIRLHSRQNETIPVMSVVSFCPLRAKRNYAMKYRVSFFFFFQITLTTQLSLRFR
ncbi:hypothetical protein ISCGN_033173 [Ixodes scapularis]